MNYVTTIEADDEQSGDPALDKSEAKGLRGNTAKRKRLLAGLAAVVMVAGGGYYAYDALVWSKQVVTDNAYVGADTAQVTPLVSGVVSEVFVSDTRPVKRGDVLVRLDDTDARLTLARAEADLAQAMRQIRGVVATDDGLTAQIAARTADQARAAAELATAQGDRERARIDLQRREALAASGSVSGEELTTARNAMRTADAKQAQARAAIALAAANKLSAIGERDANNARITGASVEDNPEVAARRAARDQARVDLARTVIRAPVDGVISRRQVQVGQRVQAGATLMAVVPLDAAYVDANFKEGQLAKVRPGQPVTLHADLYGDDVAYRGRVVGFSGGTGAAFAVVPAQNATGNWIKVVQRLPVRIAVDRNDLAAHPLRVGLSMHVDIDISE